MNKKLTLFSALIVLMFATSAFSIGGVGFHWGFDYTTTMTDNPQDEIFSLDEVPTGGIDWGAEIPDIPLAYISRMGMERTPINFGGKVFIDLLPIEFEFSMNMAVWQYDGEICYLDPEGSTPEKPVYKTVPVTISDLGGDNYFGVDKTPYGKLNFDFTLKKTFDVPVIKPSLGAGISVHSATPVLSAELVENALGVDINSIDLGDVMTPDAMKKILAEITDGAKKPSTGMHLQFGLKVKPPVVPLAVYADGKVMFMFNDIEENVGIETKGFLLNVGLMFTI